MLKNIKRRLLYCNCKNACCGATFVAQSSVLAGLGGGPWRSRSARLTMRGSRAAASCSPESLAFRATLRAHARIL
jgi:hypothetical protein